LTERFAAAVVGAPFGLQGFVKVRSLSGETGHLAGLKEAALRRDGREEVRAIEETAPAFRSLLVKFRGIDSPEAAKSLQGAEILVDRAHAAPLGDGEFYVEDLKGLEVRAADGAALGRIEGVIEGGGGDLAEVRLASGELRLVPFRKEFFGDIDPEGGSAVLRNGWILE